ncbi:MAG: DEAD/DEAH box helicase [Spirochaetia bacterium]|nr:DEAD/DEAH box helicase [Spirochaetia bacterium]
MNFNSFGLTEELLEAVNKQGYTIPTPIQAQTIPAILEGKDLIGGAQTGTGKTAAFALPILHLLNQSGKRTRNPRALVLSPTRELAAQVAESFHDYGMALSLRTMSIYGGVKINPQIAALRRGTDVLVATPGRLLDHLSQKTLDLSDIEILVLDEADRMLDMGFVRDIRKIMRFLPERRQNLLFSATYSPEIRKFSRDILNDPVVVEVSRKNEAAEKVEQSFYSITKDQKRHLLVHFIQTHSWYQALVFVSTKHGADRLSKQLLKKGIPVGAIHGNKSQNARTRTLKDFKKGDLQVLVATDVAARGIHMEGLSHVVNFNLPQVAEDYIHRIGRTGRAGKSGKSITFVSPDEKDQWNKIQRMLKTSVRVSSPEGFIPVKKDPAEDVDERGSNPRPRRQNAPRPVQQGQRRNTRSSGAGRKPTSARG